MHAGLLAYDALLLRTTCTVCTGACARRLRRDAGDRGSSVARAFAESVSITIAIAISEPVVHGGHDAPHVRGGAGRVVSLHADDWLELRVDGEDGRHLVGCHAGVRSGESRAPVARRGTYATRRADRDRHDQRPGVPDYAGPDRVRVHPQRGVP